MSGYGLWFYAQRALMKMAGYEATEYPPHIQFPHEKEEAERLSKIAQSVRALGDELRKEGTRYRRP